MSTTITPPGPQADRGSLPLTNPQLPALAPVLAAVIAFGLAALAGILLGWGLVGTLVLGWLLLLVVLPTWSLLVEGERRSKDRFVTTLVWSAFGVAMIPLVALIYQVVSKGAAVISTEFLTYSMRGVLGEGGGIYHALIGTFIVTTCATVMSVPIGVMAAIYLVEYGKGKKLARYITFLVDVMTGIPSIVAGLFAFALFTLIFGPAIRFGFGGAVALSVLMIPIVVRATEEMLKLVPDELREASYALGVPKWRTIVKVVLPTALGGIVTGITLAIARVAGETAPLLIIAGTTTSANFNPFEGRMMTLPVFIYSSVTTGGKYAAENEARAWGAALVLVAIVMILNLVARVVGRVFAPKTGR
ncbi:phosphate ABC transporter permease PstA [Nocardioides caricicola]|uniref:Phosphate transport system permease protein PstA n=1 Tax=Nocardioides caricicola TaxID=634770 RepID=A0ABW0MWU9_9ACTN